MLELIKTLPDTDIVSLRYEDMEKYGIYKIDDYYYREMCYHAVSNSGSLEYRQAVTRKQLIEYIKSKYPGKVLSAFYEVAEREVRELSKFIPGIVSGFYFTLVDDTNLLD